MIPVCVQTLVVASAPSPSILVLCPVEDYESHRNCRIVPIWMGLAEATQMGMALEGSKFSRPMTHDLFLDALTNLDASIERVEITAVEGQTFYARLVLHQGQRSVSLDARPSDAIALAVREGAPLFMAEEVLKKASFPYIFKSGIDDQEELERFHSFVENISPDDFLGEEGEAGPAGEPSLGGQSSNAGEGDSSGTGSDNQSRKD